MVFDGLMVGVNKAFDAALGPIFKLPEPYGLLVVSLIVVLISTLIIKYMTDQKAIKGLRDEMKSLQAEMKKHKEDPKKFAEMQKKSMQKTMEQFKHNFKPMLITMIPFLLLFTWLRTYYTALGNPDVLFGLSWFWSYFIFTMVLSLVLKKVLRVH